MITHNLSLLVVVVVSLHEVSKCIQNQLLKRKGRKANIFKRIRREFGTDVPEKLKEKADEKIFQIKKDFSLDLFGCLFFSL